MNLLRLGDRRKSRIEQHHYVILTKSKNTLHAYSYLTVKALELGQRQEQKLLGIDSI